jgi:hypothetical protein
MEEELGQMDTHSSSYEQCIDFVALQMPPYQLTHDNPRVYTSELMTLCRPIRDLFRLVDFLYSFGSSFQR